MNTILYNKLLLQAQEAQEQGMNKLANIILKAVNLQSEENSSYSYKELNDDIHNDLWKAATKVMNYYDADSADAVKVNEIINMFAEKFIEELEKILEKDKVVKGPFEPNVFGEE